MLWIILVIALVGLDQWTKWFFFANQARFEHFEVIRNFFYLSYVENRGAAFGILQNFRWLFIGLTLIAIGAIVWYFIRHRSVFLRISLCFIITGAIGNFIDRLLKGYVVDFLSFYPFGYNFPVFNVADICVTVGVSLLMIYLLFIYKEPQSSAIKDSEPAEPGTGAADGKDDN